MKQSITDSCRSASRSLLITWLCLLACQSTALAGFPEISFSADSIEYENADLRQVSVQLDAEGQFSIKAGQADITGLGSSYKDLLLHGTLQSIESLEGEYLIRSSLAAERFEANLELIAGSDGLLANLAFKRLDLKGFTDFDFLPAQLAWVRAGYLDSHLQVRFPTEASGQVELKLGVGGLGFDSPDGRFAAEALSLELGIFANAESWSSPRFVGSIRGGELLLDDFYRNFSEGGLEFSFQAEAGADQWVIHALKVTDDYSVSLEGGATLGLGDEISLAGIEVNRLELSFPGAYERYIEPVAAPWTLNGLEVTGQVVWSGEWSDGAFQSGNLEIEGLSIVDSQRQRFAMTGLDARMRPGDYGFDSRLAWRGLLLGKINLGSGEAVLDSEPGTFAIVEPLRLDVLGGQLNLQELKVLLPGRESNPDGEPDIRLRLDLEELDMEELTAALGWPSFSGKVSGQIPGVQLEDGVLEVDGEIRVNVFDGLITLDQLRIERPFGVLPSLAANLEAKNLDLKLFTGAFSFGQISGRIDGYMRDLRMLDWRPVAFDAWLGTPERQRGSEGISRQAVNHLTTLGGGSATTALTSPLMKLFNNFSYKRLGFGCLMQNNICEVRGVSEDAKSVLIMEGAGVPKITIRAFNRSVDWPQLLAHLAAASDGEAIRVGD